jgi:hypothetical protein
LSSVDATHEGGTGRLGSLISVLGTHVIDYDAEGRVATLADPDDITHTYGYDGPLVTSESLSGTLMGHNVEWTYDSDLRMETQSIDGANSISYTYDNDGLVTDAGAEVLVPDPLSGLLTSTTVGSVASSQGYDPNFGELESMSYTYLGSPFFDATYTRDKLGRIKTLDETVEGQSSFRCFEYDSTGRLTQVTDDGDQDGCTGQVIESYDYDANSNRIYALNSAGVVTGPDVVVDDQDRLLAHGDWTYVYSDNGELEHKENSQSNEEWDYDYDAFGSLRSASEVGGSASMRGIVASGNPWTERLSRASSTEISSTRSPNWTTREASSRGLRTEAVATCPITWSRTGRPIESSVTTSAACGSWSMWPPARSCSGWTMTPGGACSRTPIPASSPLAMRAACTTKTPGSLASVLGITTQRSVGGLRRIRSCSLVGRGTCTGMWVGIR